MVISTYANEDNKTEVKNPSDTEEHRRGKPADFFFSSSSQIFITFHILQSIAYQALLQESNFGLVFVGKSSSGTSFVIREKKD